MAIAGPLSNLILSIIFLVISTLLYKFSATNIFTIKLLNTASLMNLFLAIFNLIPIPPLDGSKILYALLPFRQKLKIRNFMDKNQFILFIILLVVIMNTNILTEIVF